MSSSGSTPSGRHLLRMVEDLLEMARNEAAPRPRRLEWVDLRAVVEEAALQLLEIPDPAPSVWIDSPPELPLVLGDGSICGGSSGASSPGPAAPPATGGRGSLRVDHRVQVVVRDHDDGGSRARVLDPVLIDPAGTSLGLALARQLAEGLGGRLEVVPDAGGATVTLSLPSGR